MRRDDALDDFYDSIFRTLLTYMMEDPQNIGPSTSLLFVAKNLERIGDHATNIAEMVYYAATGERLVEADLTEVTKVQPARNTAVALPAYCEPRWRFPGRRNRLKRLE